MTLRLWLGCLSLCACQRSATPEAPPTMAVHCVPAKTTAIRDVRQLRGTVVTAPDDDVVVASQIAGRLEHVLVREGDVVAENAVIAQLATAPLQDALDQARAQLQQAEATQENAHITYTRAQQLFTRGIVPRQQVDDTGTHERETAAAAAAARAAVRSAEHNLQRATIRTATDGVVLHVLRRPGELVDGTPATPVAEVADPNDLEFVVSVQPTDLIALHPGQHGEARFDALKDATFPVQVHNIAPVVDAATGVGTLRLVMLPSQVLPPLGLYGTASIDVGGARQGVVVQAAALRNAWGGGSEVVLCQNGHAAPHPVKVGTRDGDAVEIVEGVRAGERVVVDNVVGLVDGTPISEAP